MKNTIAILERVAGCHTVNSDDFMRSVTDAVSRLRAMEWLPIETMPKDGTQVLLYRPLAEKTNDPLIAIGYGIEWNNPCWSETIPAGSDGRNYTNRSCFATHWMPLPAQPAC